MGLADGALPAGRHEEARMHGSTASRPDGAGSVIHGQRALGMRSVNGVVAVPGHGGAIALPVTGTRLAGAGGPPHDGDGLVVVPRVGLVFPARLGFEAWLAVGARLAAAAASSAWCLGGWLVYGRSAFGGRYREAVQRTGPEQDFWRRKGGGLGWPVGRLRGGVGASRAGRGRGRRGVGSGAAGGG